MNDVPFGEAPPPADAWPNLLHDALVGDERARDILARIRLAQDLPPATLYGFPIVYSPTMSGAGDITFGPPFV